MGKIHGEDNLDERYAMTNQEDRAYQIHQKLQRDKSLVNVYAINGGFRTTTRAGNLGGATNANLMGVYDERAELGWIEADMDYMLRQK